MEQRIQGNGNVQIGRIRDATVTVTIGGGPRLEVPLEPAWIELPVDMTSPAHLLRARYGVVPYAPPGDLAERLVSWSHCREPFALRVLAGAAGTGKTRIAVELCRTLSELRWLTGLLKAHVDPAQMAALAQAPTARLVVMDYAEIRQEQLRELLLTLASGATLEHPVRVLLTVRGRTGSREEVRRVLSGRGDALDVEVHRASVDLLAELPFGEAERSDLFRKAVDELARRLGRDAQAALRLLPALPVGSLSTALMVLVAAYLAVADGRIPSGRTEFLDGLLEHEARYWSPTALAAGISADKTVQRRVVALATLAGTGVSESETRAADLLRLVPDLGDASEGERRALARWIHGLYRGAAWWNPVEPDLVGEHLVAAEYGDQAEVLAGVLMDRPADALVQPLRLLARAARDHPTLAGTLRGVLTGQIGDLSRRAVEQAARVDAPRLLLAGTTVAGALEPLVSLIPPDPEKLPAVLDDFPESNTLLWQLALTLTGQLADHYRRLAAANPAAFEPNLASALNKLGRGLSNLGRREQALAATEEAVELYRRLAAANPTAFEPNLASALNNLSVDLANLGRREQALAATEEAVKLYRILAAAKPAAFGPYLARALNNLSVCLANLGRREQALAAAEEAVKLYRILAAAKPAAFEPDLARALNNLGGDLSDLGRPEQALTAIEEAVEIRRRLAAANPAAFEPDLAVSLNNLGMGLSDLGRREQALAAIEEAVAIRRRLAAANPAAFEPDLANALNNLSADLANLGRREQALAAIEEAVEIRRRLAAANPAAFEPCLARSLWGVAWVCVATQVELDRALVRVQESLDIYGRLASQLPAVFGDDLRAVLRTKAAVLDGLGRHDEAARIRRALDELVEVDE